MEEEIFPEEDLEHVALSGEQSLELKKLEYQERDKALQLKLKELEVREKELSLEYKAKELDAKTCTAKTSEVPFDVGKHICFVPPFQESEVDKYFMHFEKVATSLKWPEDVWTVLLQSVFVGKAHEIYSALPVKHSARYHVVKDAVLKAYEQVPEAYRQKFRSSTKDDKQTYVEFACEKERLFDRWCASQEVESDFTRLHELLLIEEFKNCLPNEVKSYLDENKVETLHRAATLADNYTLTHQKVFGRSETLLQSGQRPPARGNRYNLRTNDKGQNDSMEQRRRNHSSQSAPVYHCCKRRGHVMLECWALEKKENKHKAILVVKKAESAKSATTPTDRSLAPLRVSSTDYEPFISQGLVSLVGEEAQAQSICVLRDTGASQSLLLEGVLSLSESSYTVSNVLLQGIELGIV